MEAALPISLWEKENTWQQRARAQLARLRDLLRAHPIWIFGYVVVIGALVLTVIAPSIVPYDPVTPDPFVNLEPPSRAHLFGTDSTGMDIFSRVLYAPRIDLVIAIAGTLLALAIGIPIGIIAGYYRGVGSNIIMRAADVIQAFPVFVLAMVLVAVTRHDVVNVIYAIAFVTSPVYLRLTRSQAMQVRDKSFIEAAYCIGKSDLQIVFRHLLPNSLTPALTQASVNIGYSILLTAGLSFIGAGVQVPTPEWGSMVSIGAENMITGEWWISFFPGIAIGLMVFCFALVGDSLKVLLDPRRR